MEAPLLLQFSIALFTGMVAATFIPPVRRSIPKVVEVLLWVALVVVCAFGILSVTDVNTRELSASAAWGADQMINSIAGASLDGVVGWVSDHRFLIASWMAIVAGLDIFALLLIRSRNAGETWRPRVRLREWMEIPLPAAIPQPVPVSGPVTAMNRRIGAGVAIAGTTMLTNVLGLSIWMRDVFMPRERTRIARAAEAGRVQSHSGLESLRDAAAHLQFAASAWYAAAAQPAPRSVTAKDGHVVDIRRRALNPQSIGWYGPLIAAPTNPDEGETDEPQPKRTDRLAS